MNRRSKHRLFVVLCGALTVGCASPTPRRAAPPESGICFDFESARDLPIGMAIDSPRGRDGTSVLAVSKDVGRAGGRGLRLSTSMNTEAAMWLVGASFGDVHLIVQLKSLSEDSRLGFVLVPGTTPTSDAPPLGRRVKVLVDRRSKAVVVYDVGTRGAREIAKFAIDTMPSSWHELRLARKAGSFVIWLDGFELATLRLLEEGESVGVGLSVRGAGVFDDFWIS